MKNPNEPITEYIYFTDDLSEITHTTREHSDKYASQQPCIKIEAYEDHIEALLNQITYLK